MPEPKKANTTEAPGEDSGKPSRTRSPGYPGINLETAVKRVREFYEKEHWNPANYSIAAKHWNLKPTSSSALVTLAAVKAFGLIEVLGSGNNRKVKLTELAKRILLDTRSNSPDRDAALKQAALRPKMHALLWKKWGLELPSDENLRHSLIFEWNFNENTASDFIRSYKDTIRFAKLNESDKVTQEDGDNVDAGVDGSAYVPKIGDYVQWESNGVLQFQEPKRVRQISEDGEFAFVDGSHTGLRVGELNRAKAPSNPVNPALLELRNPMSTNKHMQEDVFSLSEGKVVLQWPTPLSADSIQDLKDWLKIVERKIARSVIPTEPPEQS